MILASVQDSAERSQPPVLRIHGLDLKKMYVYFPQIKEKGFESEYDAYQYLGKSESCFAMFRYSIGQKDRYITAVDNGGSNGAATVYVSELKEDVFSTIYKFEVQNSGYGSVIRKTALSCGVIMISKTRCIYMPDYLTFVIVDCNNNGTVTQNE